MPSASSSARRPVRSPRSKARSLPLASAAGHRLELGERAHARSGKPSVVKAPFALRIGQGARFRRGDEHEIAFAHALEQLDHVAVRQAHAAMRGGPADQVLVVGAMQIDVAGARVAALAAIDALLEPVEGEDAGEDEIVVARLSAPSLAGPLARDEHRAERRLLADPPADGVPARRGAERALLAADAVPRGRHRPGGDRHCRLRSRWRLGARRRPRAAAREMSRGRLGG